MLVSLLALSLVRQFPCMGQAAPEDGLVGLWALDEGAGLRAADTSGHGHDGEVMGAEWTEGRAGAALRFQGGDDRVDFPVSEAFGLSSNDTFTVEVWLRTTRRDFCTPLMARDGGNVSFSLILGRQPGRVAWEVWSWGQVKLISQTDVADGSWHHVIGCHDGDTGLACLLVDGRVEAVAPAGTGGPEQAQLRLGNNIGAHQPFSGDLDEVRISRGLPPAAREAIEAHRRWTLLTRDQLREMQQAYLDRMARPRNPHAKSIAEWEARREQVKRHVLASLGLDPLPERLPLNVHIAGELDREGYVVQRLYWQTWPGYYAGGYLYLPKGLRGQAPGVLNPHGHWENGCRNPVVQSRLIALARKGYVCLTIDSVHAYDYYSGVTPLSVMIWNDIRALDLLCSLPEVDAGRIGCTGCSGGGQQTFYLMAVDDRLQAAVPVCMVCELRRILAIDSHHCPCNHVAGLMADTDETEMAACLAPKPSLYICVTGDWTKWFPQEGYPEIRSVFELYGATDHVECIQHEWHHDYNQLMREQAYAWFNRWLKGVDDPAQAAEGTIETEDPAALAAMGEPPPDARGIEAVFEERRASRAAPPFDTTSRESAAESASRVRQGLGELFREPTAAADPAAEVLSREPHDGVLEVRLLVRTEPDVRVPVVLLLPEGRGGPLPGVVVASGAGKATVLATGWETLAAVVREGLAVALVDARFTGEWSLEAATQRLNGIFFGRPPAAVGSHDLAAVAAWLGERPEVTGRTVGVVGLDDAGPPALMAAALGESIGFAAAPAIGATYAAGRQEPTASHLVTVGDLPEIAAACVPRPVLIGAVGQEEIWQVTREAYAACDAEERLVLHSEAMEPLGEGLWAWVKEQTGSGQ